MESKSHQKPQHQPTKKTQITHQRQENHDPSTSASNRELLDPLIFQHFPHELFIEVLSRLPVKSLLKFKCVSRSWLSLISSDEFIKTHLKNNDFDSHNIIITVLPPNLKSHLKQCSVESALEGLSNEVNEIDYPMKNSHKSVSVVGSCDGLVCIFIDEIDLFLWNPLLRKSKKLPDMCVASKYVYYIFGFGYDMLNDDYKVVGISCDFHGDGVCETVVKVYSLKNDSWGRIEDFKGAIPVPDSGKYANGKLHWSCCFQASVSWKIVSLDLGEEMYGEVEHPDFAESLYDWTFGVLRGCLSVFGYYEGSRADVWVMKEYGFKDSWTKVVSIRYPTPVCFFRTSPVCLLRNGGILLVFHSGLELYDPRGNKFGFFPINKLQEVNVYVESLVSPNAYDGEQRQYQ